MYHNVNIYFKYLSIYFKVRERAEGGGAGKERNSDSTLSAEPNLGFDLRILKAQPESKPRVRHLTYGAHPGTPIMLKIPSILAIGSPVVLLLLLIVLFSNFM